MLNRRSGTVAKLGIDRAKEQIAATFAANGISATVVVVAGSQIRDRVTQEIAERRSREWQGFDVIVVGGGDGSISSAAAAITGTDIPLGILPLGTLNHFARDLGVPLDLEAAIRAIAGSRAGVVDVGEVNGRLFVNNSSLGIYPHLVAERDRFHSHGPARWFAAAIALCRVLWRLPRPRVRVRAPGWQAERRTTCLFIANNMYRRDGFAGATRERLDRGELCLYMASRDGRMALIQLALRAFLGRLESERDFVLARLKSVEILAPRGRLRVALDGESLVLRTPLHYRIRPRALRVIFPGPMPP